MSTMYWQGDKIIQGVRDESSELGYVGFDDNTKSYVLWLKDHEGIFIGAGSYIRGDEWSSKAEAKGKAALSASARLAHFIWMKQASKKSKSNRSNKEKSDAIDITNKNSGFNFSIVNHINNQENHYNMEVKDSGVGFQVILNIGEGDSDAFVKALTTNGMSESDAKDLAEIMPQEKPESSEKPFGKKAMNWITQNLWKVSNSVGVNLLTEAAKKFYGLNS